MEKDLITNKKAFHDYAIGETFEAGMVLVGTEVKSLKSHQGSIQEAYVYIKEKEVWLSHASIPPYKYGTIETHAEKRERKLLLHKKEIEKLRRQTQEKGMTIVPLAIYVVKGCIKIKIALAKGKKQYDKREAIKKREEEKRIRKIIK